MIPKLVAALTLIGLIYGGLSWVDGRYAKCQEVKEVKKAVDMLSTGIARDAQQRQLWALEDRYKTNDPNKVINPRDRQDMRELQQSLPVLQDRLKALEAKQ